MIKTIITAVVTAIAGLIGYLVSDGFRERMAQRFFAQDSSSPRMLPENPREGSKTVGRRPLGRE